MTPKQKYLFDLRGYLHLENVLTPEELSNAQTAIERLVQAAPDELPSSESAFSEWKSDIYCTFDTNTSLMLSYANVVLLTGGVIQFKETA